MKIENLIVTAFFDIGRETEKNSKLSRSNMQYMEYFKVWARLENELVVYTEPKFANEIKKIREQFKLGNITYVIIIDNIYEIENEIYKRMKRVSQEGESQRLKLHLNAMSGKAEYDYLMLLKYYFMSDAVKRLKKTEGNVSWIDFGFNHGTVCYTDANDFAFKWCPNLENDIHVFSLRNPKDINSLGYLLLQADCIMGAPIIADVNKSYLLWKYCREAMLSLLSLDTIDDDQQLLLMAYKLHQEDFCIHKSGWFLPIKQFGGEHMKVRHNERKSKFKLLKEKVYRILSTLKAIIFRKYGRPQPLDYGKRMQQYCKNVLEANENEF